MTIEQIWDEARVAATEAGYATQTTPMVVALAKGFSNEIIPGTEEVVNEGVCGFAWIKISGRGKLAKFTKDNGYSHRGVYGGYEIWATKLFDYNGQSLERKENAMYAAQKVFEKHGIKATVYSRMD